MCQYGVEAIRRTMRQKSSVQQVENQRASHCFLRLARCVAHRLGSRGRDSHQALLCGYSAENARACAQKMARAVGKHRVDPSSRQCGIASSVQSEGVFIEKGRHQAGRAALFALSRSLRLLALRRVERQDAR